MIKNRHKTKVCAICGKVQRDQWARHFERKHNRAFPIDWDGISGLKGTPWCKNWQDVLEGAEPVDIAPDFFGGRPTSKTPTDFAPTPSQLSQQRASQVLNIPSDLAEEVSKRFEKMTDYIGNKRQAEQEVSSLEEEVHSHQISAPLRAVSTFKMPDPKNKGKKRLKNMTGLTKESEVLRQLSLLNESQECYAKKESVLFELLPYFTDSLVQRTIQEHKGKLQGIRDLIIKAAFSCNSDSEELFAKLIFCCFLFGGTTSQGVFPAFFELKTAKKEAITVKATTLLATQFNQAIAEWLIDNFMVVEDQTLHLCDFLSKRESQQQGLILKFSTAVQIDDISAFAIGTETFISHPIHKVMKENFENITYHKQKKVPLDEYLDLLYQVRDITNNALIESLKAGLVGSPLDQWMRIIKQGKVKQQLDDIGESVDHFLGVFFTSELQRRVIGKANQKFLTNLNQPGSKYQITFNISKISPNNKQFAIAQHSVLQLVLNPKQNIIWKIASGRGKSRVINALVLILFIQGLCRTIHIVYNNKHLMRRDQRNFAKYFELHSSGDQIQWHCNLKFDSDPKDVLVFDEIDAIMFEDLVNFAKVIANRQCIGFTATPSDGDTDGIEELALKCLKFTQISEEKKTEFLAIDEILPVEPGKDFIDHLLKSLEDRPGILYCTKSLKDMLSLSGTTLIQVEDQSNFDDEILLNLGQRTSEDIFPLVVCTSNFGTRGIDYRSEKIGTNIFIAASFSNQRDAQQALGRVGRNNDPCTRYLLKGVNLVDSEFQMNHFKKLIPMYEGLKHFLSTQVNTSTQE